jgi:hypothetical protein
LGFAVMIRPSAALFLPVAAVVFVVAVWRRDGFAAALRRGAALTLGATALMVVFALGNWWRFGSPFDLGYQTVKQSYPVLEGLTNQLFSPGKSFFLYAPIAVLAPIGVVLAIRRRPMETTLLSLMAAANLVFFARVPFWAGDAAYGPRYTLIILPLVVPLAAPVLAAVWGRRAAVALSGVGAVVAILGVLVYFNVFFAKSFAPLKGDLGRTEHELAWQPILGQVELIPAAVRETVGDERPSDPKLAVYSSDPTTHYGFYSSVPRLDLWWTWVGATSGNPFTYVYLLLPIGCFVGAFVLSRRRDAPSPDEIDAADVRAVSSGGQRAETRSDASGSLITK